MNNYVRYRNWWMKHQAPHEWQMRPQEAFKQHIESMSLFELMETLEGFGEEDNDEYASGSQPEKMMEEWAKEFDKVGQLPNFARPYIKYPTQNDPKPKCQKCGIALSGVMGYVCSDNNCPTFMKATC